MDNETTSFGINKVTSAMEDMETPLQKTDIVGPVDDPRDNHLVPAIVAGTTSSISIDLCLSFEKNCTTMETCDELFYMEFDKACLEADNQFFN